MAAGINIGGISDIIFNFEPQVNLKKKKIFKLRLWFGNFNFQFQKRWINKFMAWRILVAFRNTRNFSLSFWDLEDRI